MSWRRAGVILIGLLALSAVLDRAGAFGYRGDDWTMFDRQSFDVRRVLAGDLIVIDHNGREQPVRLIGIDAPDEGIYWHEQSAAYLRQRVEGQAVMLRLDSTVTRQRNGAVRAYVYLSPDQHINRELIRSGQAYADRREKHSHQADFEQFETEARRRGLGLWAEVTEQQMPPWRQQWLEHYRRQLAEERGL